MTALPTQTETGPTDKFVGLLIGICDAPCAV